VRKYASCKLSTVQRERADRPSCSSAPDTADLRMERGMLALYHNDMSLCAEKVRICLAEKDLEWEDRHIALRSGEHQKEWYRKLNRRAVVPTLIDGDKVITESNVILEYLDERFPEPSLSPKDPFGRAKMRLWTKQLDEDIHDACAAIITFGLAFRHQYLQRGEQGKQMLEQLLDEMEEALSKHPWLAGDTYSLADVAFTPYIVRLEHLSILQILDNYPRVSDWYARCKQRPSFDAAIRKWENADYLALMRKGGEEHWPEIATMITQLKAAA
jgi:glutathione S-transferase